MKFIKSVNSKSGHLIMAGILSFTLGACSSGGDGTLVPANPTTPVVGTGAPQIVGSIDIPGSLASAVAVSGNYAYVGAGTDGLQIIDISNKTTPTAVTLLDTINVGQGMTYISGVLTDNLYVTAGIQGVYNVNVTDPSTPFVEDSVNTPGNAGGLSLSIDLSAICTADGATGSGSGVGSVIVHSAIFLNIATEVTTTERANYAAINGNYCFVTAGNELNGADSPKLYVIQISPSVSTTPVATLDLTGAPSGIAIIGNYAYIVASGDPGMYAIDISSPTSPVIAGQTGAFPGTGAIAVDETRMRAYIATPDTVGFPDEGFKIVDISNADAPTVIATATLPNDTIGIDVLDGFVYATTSPVFGGSGASQFHIVDVSAY